MKVLHIYRTLPDPATRVLAAAWQAGNQGVEVHLALSEGTGPVDYDRLLALILDSDRVVCW
jgi:hypothetical protein